MKHVKGYYIFLFILLTLSTKVIAQKKWQGTNNGQELRVFIKSEDTIYTCAYGGGICRSIDGGLSWHYPSNNVALEVNGLFMSNNNIGYYYTYERGCPTLCPGSSIYKTYDGGCNWSRVSTPIVSPNEYITGITFQNSTIGWVCTNVGKIYKTVDGSNTWALQFDAGSTLLNIKSNSLQNIVATGANGKVVSSQNGGSLWTVNNLDTGWDIIGISFIDDNRIFIAGRYIYQSNNGGTTWQAVPTLPGITGFVDVSFRDANYGMALSNNQLLLTTDGGVSWSQIPNDGQVLLGKIQLIGSSTFVFGKGTILKKQPGPNYTWKIISNFFVSPLHTILRYSHDYTRCFVDGRLSSMLFKSDDDGLNWVRTSHSFTGVYNINQLSAISIDGLGNGICVGNSGVILTTLNNGKDWYLQLNNYPQPNVTNNLLDVQLTNSGYAWAVGQNGYILKSIDRGVNWKLIPSGFTDNLSSVCFIDNNNGWASGFNRIIKSNDGGSIWQTQIAQPGRDFRQVKFLNSTLGWAINNSLSGTDTTYLLNTTDGGTTWQKKITISYPYSFYQYAPLEGIDIINNNILRAYTEDSIYLTQNGGQSWVAIDFPKPIKEIKFSNTDTGYLLSSQSIYITVNGGLSWSEYKPLDEITFSSIDTKPGKVVICGAGQSIISNSANVFNESDWIFEMQPRGYTDGNYVFDFTDSLYGWKYHQVNKDVSFSTNGGHSWKVHSKLFTTNDSVLTDLFLSTRSIGYATDNKGNFLKTNNQGKTWQYTNVSSSGAILNSISFIDSDNGFFAGTNGLVVSTTNGGTSFQTNSIPSNESIRKIVNTSKGTAWLCTSNAIYYTNNYGATWINKDLPEVSTTVDISFINDSTGWVLAYPSNRPVTFRTRNFGTTWIKDTILYYPNDPITAIAFNKITENGIAIKYASGLGGYAGSISLFPSLKDSLVATFRVDTINFCKREIMLSAASNINPTNFNWNIGGQSFSGSPVRLVLPNTIDSFSINLYANALPTNLCASSLQLEDTVTKSIKFDPVQTAKFRYDSACNNSLFHFTNLSLPLNANMTFWWSFGDGTTSVLQNPSHQYFEAGNYTVKMISISSNGCPSDTFSTNINANKVVTQPIIKSNDLDCSNSTTVLNAPQGYMNYIWSPSLSLSSTTIFNPIASPNTTTTYFVTYRDNSNCIYKDSIKIFVTSLDNSNNIYIPNAFTPNNDGKNDCFSPKMRGVFSNYTLNIYNRWGERIFSSNNPNSCWDGKYKNLLQDSGNFVYYLEAQNECGKIFKKGNVILIR